VCRGRGVGGQKGLVFFFPQQVGSSREIFIFGCWRFRGYLDFSRILDFLIIGSRFMFYF